MFCWMRERAKVLVDSWIEQICIMTASCAKRTNEVVRVFPQIVKVVRTSEICHE